MISLETLAHQRQHFGKAKRKRRRGRQCVERTEAWQRQRDMVKAKRELEQEWGRPKKKKRITDATRRGA